MLTHTYLGTKTVATAFEFQNSEVNVINLFRLPRRGEIIIQRLRIVHTYLTHGHLLRGKTPHRCLACQVELTV